MKIIFCTLILVLNGVALTAGATSTLNVTATLQTPLAATIDMSKADNCFIQQVKEADATTEPGANATTEPGANATTEPSILMGCGSDIVSNQPTAPYSQIADKARYILSLHETLKTKMGSPAHLSCQDFDSPAILLVLCKR